MLLYRYIIKIKYSILLAIIRLYVLFFIKNAIKAIRY